MAFQDNGNLSSHSTTGFCPCLGPAAVSSMSAVRQVPTIENRRRFLIEARKMRPITPVGMPEVITRKYLAPLRSRVLMSVSTSEPPPPAPLHSSADWQEPSPPGTPVELTSVEMFEAALLAYKHRTYLSVDPCGVVRERPVLLVVESYSKSCRACIGMRRTFERCAQEHVADVACFKFDVNAVPRLAQKLGIRALPTFILFKRAVRVDHFSASARETLEENILDNL